MLGAADELDFDDLPRYAFGPVDVRRLQLITSSVSSIIELRKDSLIKVARDVWLD
jgi:hypothetical protein